MVISKDVSQLIVFEGLVALINFVLGWATPYICNQLGNWDAFYNLYLPWLIITTTYPPIHIFYLKKNKKKHYK